MQFVNFFYEKQVKTDETAVCANGFSVVSRPPAGDLEDMGVHDWATGGCGVMQFHAQYQCKETWYVLSVLLP